MSCFRNYRSRKSSFINGVSDGQTKLESRDSANAVTVDLYAAEFYKNSFKYTFIDTPGLSDEKGDEANINEIKKAASEYPDFSYILILFNFQVDRIDKSTVNALEEYMKIFPVQYFWEHVIIVYTHVYPKGISQKIINELKEKIVKKKGDFVRAISSHKDYKNFRTFMKKNNINIPNYIDEYFVNSQQDVSDIDDETKDQYNKILEKIKDGKLVFQKIDHVDRKTVVETGGRMNKIKTLRKIIYYPRIGSIISLDEFLIKEEDATNQKPISYKFEKENTYNVVSKKCKKFYKYNVYKINKYKGENGEIIEGNKN